MVADLKLMNMLRPTQEHSQPPTLACFPLHGLFLSEVSLEPSRPQMEDSHLSCSLHTVPPAADAPLPVASSGVSWL